MADRAALSFPSSSESVPRRLSWSVGARERERETKLSSPLHLFGNDRPDRSDRSVDYRTNANERGIFPLGNVGKMSIGSAFVLCTCHAHAFIRAE